MLQYFPVKEEALQRIQTCTEEDHSCHNVAVTRRCCHQTLLSHEVAVTTLLSHDVAVTRGCCHTRLLSHDVITQRCCHTTLSHDVAVTRRCHTMLLSHDVVTRRSLLFENFRCYVVVILRCRNVNPTLLQRCHKLQFSKGLAVSFVTSSSYYVVAT